MHICMCMTPQYATYFACLNTHLVFFSGRAAAVFLCFSSVWMLSLSACKILYAKCIYIIQTSQIIIVRKCKSLKMALISTYVQKFGQGYWCSMMPRSCTSSRLKVSTICLQNLGHKQQIIIAQHLKLFLLHSSCPKIALFCVCVQMFGKNEMILFHPIFLQNHTINMHTCMASSSWHLTQRNAGAVCMRTTLSKRVCAGQSENDNFPRFK